MMSLLPLLVFINLIFGSFAAVYLERLPLKPGFEKMCYDEANGIFYSKGEEMTWTRKGCGRKICRGSSGSKYSYAEIQTCGKISYPPECEVEVNPTMPYPYCCEVPCRVKEN